MSFVTLSLILLVFNMLNSNEIIVNACPVRYSDVEYHDNYVVITQNRTRRRVYSGYYFEDTGTHIYVSTACSHWFQHKRKARQFILNTVTKEYRDLVTYEVERNHPERVNPVENNLHDELTK